MRPERTPKQRTQSMPLFAFLWQPRASSTLESEHGVLRNYCPLYSKWQKSSNLNVNTHVWIFENSLKTNQTHFDCLNRPSQWVNLSFSTDKFAHIQEHVHTHTNTHIQAFPKWSSSDDLQEGFRAKGMDTITPPSIIALREERKSNQRVTEM